MDQEQGKSGWVILSCEAESIVENLLRRLEANGIGPQRLTLVRIDREPSPRTWPAQESRQPRVETKSDLPSPSGFNNDLLIHSLLWGVILAIIGLSFGVRRYSSGSLATLTLLFFLGGSIFSLLVAHLRRSENNRSTHPQPSGTSDVEPPLARTEPILVGIKIARGQVEKVEEIARELVSRTD